MLGQNFALKRPQRPRKEDLDTAPERPRHGGVLRLEEAVRQPVPVLVEAVVLLLLDPDLSLVNQPGRTLIIVAKSTKTPSRFTEFSFV